MISVPTVTPALLPISSKGLTRYWRPVTAALEAGREAWLLRVFDPARPVKANAG